MKTNLKQKKQDYLLNFKIFALLGFEKQAGKEWVKACEIHLKLSNKNKAQ